MRLRATWMYFVEEMTQHQIAEHLGVGRVTVVRLLSDARERHEISFRIEGDLPECVGLERDIERRFAIAEAIVVPVSHQGADPALAISAATGAYLSSIARPGMKIGVGWGRTLLESLAHIDGAPMPEMSVISLLGGITKAKRFNPSEFAWRFASLFQAECYLMTAPAIVDSAETRKTLIDRCGLGEVFEMAKALDTVLLSVGELEGQGTAYRHGVVSEEVRQAMVAQGAVGEFLFNFFDARGKPIDHPIQQRVMSIPLSTLNKVPARVLSSGGLHKTRALLGAIRLMRPTVLVTDEFVARALLESDARSD